MIGGVGKVKKGGAQKRTAILILGACILQVDANETN
jgi:hypothetical protein